MLSRELLNEEYINRRAEDHNAWVADSDEAWRSRRIRLPYPPFARYPTEEDIVIRATIMYTFINPNRNDIGVVTTTEEKIKTEHEIEKQVVMPALQEEYVVKEEAVAEISPNKEDIVDKKETVKSNNLLPGWIRRRTT